MTHDTYTMRTTWELHIPGHTVSSQCTSDSCHPKTFLDSFSSTCQSRSCRLHESQLENPYKIHMHMYFKYMLFLRAYQNDVKAISQELYTSAKRLTVTNWKSNHTAWISICIRLVNLYNKTPMDWPGGKMHNAILAGLEIRLWSKYLGMYGTM